VESPSDTQYTPARPHVLQHGGDGIVGPHFAVLAIEPTDVNQDLLTMQNGGDRSRTEIKIAPSKGGMHDAFKSRDGDTFVYAWRFKIAPGMKFSPSFTHIHQIKAYGGIFADPPLITFTTLANGSMEVRHVGDLRSDSSTSKTLGSMSLAGVFGQWLDVREEITYSNTIGRYQLTIRDQAGEVALVVDKSGLEMWRTGAYHMRPKWGIYRRHHASLNQNVRDYVYFANFAVTRGSRPDSACR
ncbi:MAG: heparin lyase I family protein, partial [Betaproteobacteria bacterium]